MTTPSVRDTYDQQSDGARTLFRLALLHPGPDLVPGAVAALVGSTVPEATWLLGDLTNAGLYTKEDGRYTIAGEALAFAAELADSESSSQECTDAFLRLMLWYRNRAIVAQLTVMPGIRYVAGIFARPPAVEVNRPHDAAAALGWLFAEQENLAAIVQVANSRGYPAIVCELAEAMWALISQGGDYTLGEVVFKAGMHAAGGIGDFESATRMMLGLARVYIAANRPGEAGSIYRRALEWALLTGDRWGEGSALEGLGSASHGADPQVSGEHYTAAMRVYEEIRDELGVELMRWRLAQMAILPGDYDTAIKQATSAEAGFIGRSREAHLRSQAANTLGRALRLAGRDEEARVALRRAVSLAGAGTAPQDDDALDERAHVVAGQGDLAADERARWGTAPGRRRPDLGPPEVLLRHGVPVDTDGVTFVAVNVSCFDDGSPLVTLAVRVGEVEQQHTLRPHEFFTAAGKQWRINRVDGLDGPYWTIALLRPLETLFDFRFSADLSDDRVWLLREATGMRIGDVENLWKDTPGRGEIAPGVSICLYRPGSERHAWALDATTREPYYDTAAVASCRQRIRDLLAEFCDSYQEITPPA